MTNPTPQRDRRNQFPTLPTGDVVVSYPTYPEALAAVDRLAKEEFPVDKVSIVGYDLRSVERVTGRMTYARAALAGAASGAWFGLFVSLLFMVWGTVNTATAVAPILLGAGFGMIFGIVSYSLQRRRKDFTSVTQVIAERYALVVDGDVAARARQLLQVAPSGFPPPAVTAPTADPADPDPQDEGGEVSTKP